ncbi:hypothetical protein KCG44_09665 [Pacificimonas sp. WHA3]|uniref:Ava_C0101 and related proteins n=1 Tax=Pacificimonas pallii TaxID=2827236 RepID=A0ABS6SF75_9SPHN|nr:hypothetical protein [Pacificimonas pallii]
MRWPELDYAAERGVYETLHAYLQVIGKLPTRTSPWVNHGWHAALRVVPRGFRTYVLPAGDEDYELLLDAVSGAVRLWSSDGRFAAFPLDGQTVARFAGQLEAALSDLGARVPLHGGPNEVEEAVPFATDDRPRAWDGTIAQRLHAAFRSVDRVFQEFRSGYLGKSSPSHLFWGSFDLAVTRFSGRTAPEHPGGFPNLPDRVTREAYSHEVISAGFWPGGGGIDEAAVYAYAYPSPKGLKDVDVKPRAARWHEGLGELVLTYADMRAAADPDAALMAFLESSYAGAAALLNWPEGLTVPKGPVGRPPEV